MPAAPREYFYLVDREGTLHHDGTALTDERFLRFFFRRLEPNTTGKHPDCPFVSPCGSELNFVRPEETVIVFRRLHADGRLEYTGGLMVPLEPDGLVVATDGRLYHRAPVGGHGLLRTSVAMQLSERIAERDGRFVFVTADGEWPIASVRRQSD